MKDNGNKIKFPLVLLSLLSSLILVFPIQLAYAGTPTVLSAKIIAANTIVIVYSEPVITLAVEYSDLKLTSGGPRNVVLLLGSGTDTITLTFDGAAASAGETGTIDITGPISVSTGQPLVPLNDQPITDGQAPLAPNTPTAAAGPIIDAAEEAAGFDIVAQLGTSNALTGDTLELLLGGSSFPTSLTRVLTAGDIAADQFTFNIASGQLGADGLKSITSRVIDVSNNVGQQSLPLLLTLDAGIVPASSANNSIKSLMLLFETVFPQQITFSQEGDTTLTGKKNSFDTKMDTKLIKVNEPFDLKISFQNNPAFTNIHKIQLFLDIYEKSIENKKDVLIIFDKFSGLKVIDKKEYFSEISFEMNSNTNSIELIFHITAQKPMDDVDFNLQYIDLVKNSRTIQIPHALKVVENLPYLPKEETKIIPDPQAFFQIDRYDFIIMENSQIGIRTPDFNLLDEENTKPIQEAEPIQWYELIRYQTNENYNVNIENSKKSTIPSGIKEQAYWWANGKISDDEFRKGIKYLLKKELLVIPNKIELNFEQEIPYWLKLDNEWWDNPKMVSDIEFISTMENLMQNNLITVQ